MYALLDPMTLASVFAGVLGLIGGSFLNVVIHRGPSQWGLVDGESRGTLAAPRSYCPACKTPIPATGLVPLVSYIIQKVRCCACGATIPARYPIVEALGALVALAAFATFGWTWAALAGVATFVQFWWYAVSAVMPDGESVLSPECFGIVRGLNRPIRIQWLEVPGALFYLIYKRGAASTYLWWFETVTDLYFDDDLTNAGATSIEGPPVPTGMLPCWPVGTRTDLSGGTWYAFLVAGCAVSRIDRVYQGEDRVADGMFGSTFAVPGKTGFTALFGDVYIDINGRRYTV